MARAPSDLAASDLLWCVAEIFFQLVASLLATQNGALLELAGEAPTVHFGKVDAAGALTLIHNATEDELVCSGKIKATDVLIVGTSTTVADLIGEVATLRQEMAAVKQFVGMMPPPASPPPAATPLPQGHQCYHVGVQHYSDGHSTTNVCSIRIWVLFVST